MSVDALLRQLRERREEIVRTAADYGAHHVRVFGSVARGDAGPDSDLDLLVQFEPGATLLSHAALVRELEALLGRKVDANERYDRSCESGCFARRSAYEGRPREAAGHPGSH